jgi:uncharacterized membrane protein YidH (DUF202 family)
MPNSLQTFIPEIVTFISDSIIPFILAVGFLVLVFNIVRYFVIGATNPEGKETAKQYLLYSILAFVIIIVFSGVINLLVLATDLDSSKYQNPPSDFIEAFK